jgi:hypothetical protein
MARPLVLPAEPILESCGDDLFRDQGGWDVVVVRLDQTPDRAEAQFFAPFVTETVAATVARPISGGFSCAGCD